RDKDLYHNSALIGLWRAALRFDPTRGVQFVSYAERAIRDQLFRTYYEGQPRGRGAARAGHQVRMTSLDEPRAGEASDLPRIDALLGGSHCVEQASVERHELLNFVFGLVGCPRMRMVLRAYYLE